jgi:hypothetical protein
MVKRFVMYLFLCALLAACGGGQGSGVSAGGGTDGTGGTGSGGNNTIVGSGQGALRVSITDAPSQEYKEINITISGVRVHMSADAGDAEAGWSELTLPSPLRVDLLGLQGGVLQELGILPLEAGHYQQIRLMIVPNSGTEPPFNNSVVYSPDGTDVEMPLTIPTEDTTGIKLVHQFTVEEGETVDLVLDLDGKKSVVAQGNGKFMLKPVIKATVMQTAP